MMIFVHLEDVILVKFLHYNITKDEVNQVLTCVKGQFSNERVILHNCSKLELLLKIYKRKILSRAGYIIV